MTIHWLWDAIIVISGVNLFALGWFCVGWYNAKRPPKLTEREQFLVNAAKSAMRQKRAA